MRNSVFGWAAVIGLILLIAPVHAQQSPLQELLQKLTPPAANDAATTAEKSVERRVPFSNGEIQLSFAPLVEQVAASVVNVYAARRVQSRSPFANDPFFDQFFGGGFSGPPRVQSSLGSGVIVAEEGLVVTNYHVIEGADEVRIALSDGREFESTVILRDESADLAVLRINNGARFPALEFASSDGLAIGDLVLAIGNPFGVGQTITSGIVSAVARNRVGVSEFGFFIQTDAAINPGNSGGALVDMSGNLVGINTAIFTRSGGSNGIGFAIPSDMVRAVVNQAARGNTAFERPYIGADFQPVTAEIADALGLPRPSGALVSDVVPDGPAARAGLVPGDVVVAVNDWAIEHPDALGYRLATIGPSQPATFDVLSKNRTRTINIMLGSVVDAPVAPQYLVEGRSPFAGATLQALTPRLASQLRLRSTGVGVVVVEVLRGSPAGRTGIRPGDIIVSVNGLELTDLATAREAIARGERSWRFTINRDGRLLRQFLRY